MALGKGLEALFDENQVIDEAKNSNSVVYINLENIRPNPYQPRKKFSEEKLNELSISIKEHGVFQPIIVREAKIGYEILAGERRFRASKIAGQEEIPAVIKDFSDTEMMEISLLENIQRE